jgi:hemolysin III
VSTTIELLVIRPTAVPGHAHGAGRAAECVLQPASADRAEELANTLTHGVGVALSLAALHVLVRVSITVADPHQALGRFIYGASLVLLYTASTLYHGCRHARRKQVLLLLDHIGIYLLIAGTYTPLALLAMHGRLGSAPLVLVWALALAGSVDKMARFPRIAADSPWSYVALSWLVLVASGPIAGNVSPVVFHRLVIGGVFYAMGLGFFMKGDRRYYHAIWHLFVLAGSICHFRAVLAIAE